MNYDVELIDTKLVSMMHGDRFDDDPEPRQPSALYKEIGKAFADAMDAERRGDKPKARRLHWHQADCDCLFCVNDRN